MPGCSFHAQLLPEVLLRRTDPPSVPFVLAETVPADAYTQCACALPAPKNGNLGLLRLAAATEQDFHTERMNGVEKGCAEEEPIFSPHLGGYTEDDAIR